MRVEPIASLWVAVGANLHSRGIATETHPTELASVVTGFCTTCAIPTVQFVSVVQKPSSTETSSVGRATLPKFIAFNEAKRWAKPTLRTPFPASNLR